MESLKLLQKKLQELEKKVTSLSSRYKKLISSLHTSQQKSATNLIHYLALRNEDIRLLQDKLHQAGLSSLASSESHVLKQIQSIRERLGDTISEIELSQFDDHAAQNELNRFTTDLFGIKQDATIPHIMVTLDALFLEKTWFFKELIESGMNIARINCAHNDEST